MTTKKPDMGLTTKKIEGSALLAEAKAKGGRIDVRDKGRSGVVGLVLRVTGNDVRTIQTHIRWRVSHGQSGVAAKNRHRQPPVAYLDAVVASLASLDVYQG